MHGTREAITSQPSTGVQNWLEDNRGAILGITGLTIGFIALGAFVVAVSTPTQGSNNYLGGMAPLEGIATIIGVLMAAVGCIAYIKDQKYADKKRAAMAVKTTIQEEVVKRTTKQARMVLLLTGYVTIMFGLGLFLNSRQALDSSNLLPCMEPNLNLCFSMGIITAIAGAGLVVVSGATKVAEKIALALHDSGKKKAVQQSEAAFNAQVE